MTRRSLCLAVVLVAELALGPSQAARADLAILSLQSQPGDYIGQGMNFDITYTGNPGPSTISAQIRSRLPDGSPSELLFVLSGGVGDGPNTFALLFFGTDRLNIPIQPGTYTMAERADFASPGHPGLDVGFQNRGSNMDYGNFTITDVAFSADGQQILRFAATFEQHSERPSAPALFGSFSFNEPANPVPEPASVVLLGVGTATVLGAGWRRWRRAAA